MNIPDLKIPLYYRMSQPQASYMEEIFIKFVKGCSINPVSKHI